MTIRSIVDVTPPNSPELTTLDDVKLELGISGSDQDDLLERLIETESARISGYPAIAIFPKTVVAESIRVQDERNLPTLKLRMWPVFSITSITEGSVVLSVDEYEVDKAAGLIYRISNDSPASWSSGKIVVSYVAGFDAVPTDIASACIELIKRRLAAQGRDSALVSESIEDVGAWRYKDNDGSSEASGVPADIKAILDRYVPLSR